MPVTTRPSQARTRLCVSTYFISSKIQTCATRVKVQLALVIHDTQPDPLNRRHPSRSQLQPLRHGTWILRQAATLTNILATQLEIEHAPSIVSSCTDISQSIAKVLIIVG
eukprot:scpid95380/ scgid4454/ 